VVTVGARRRRRAAARSALEREAAETIEARIAEGRPPPEVWRAGAWRRAERGLGGATWYPQPAPARRSPVTEPFVLLSVRIPAGNGETAVPSPEAAGRGASARS
jgi:hypothetical protein